jgi:hypothetical protein
MELRAQVRYALRSRAGVEYRFQDGRVITWPSYTSALRGRAMIDCLAHIIEIAKELEP